MEQIESVRSGHVVVGVDTHKHSHWCNTERIPTMLKGLSPVQYRAQVLAAKALT